MDFHDWAELANDPDGCYEKLPAFIEQWLGESAEGTPNNHIDTAPMAIVQLAVSKIVMALGARDGALWT